MLRRTKVSFNLYSGRYKEDWIPDVQLVKVSGDSTDRSVHFLWRGEKQWLALSTDNDYGDGCWLVVKTDYTKKFEKWLDKNLDGYDSLESMFTTGLDEVIPVTYEIDFVVAD
jgi:hypothetical protein